MATLKNQVDLLLSRIAETDERIVAIDAKRKLVDEVQTKANAIVHVLDDVRINLETLGEKKAVIDHVAEKVAQLEFMLQEARNTLRTLQHERELAERIELGIKQLRSKTVKSDDDGEDARRVEWSLVMAARPDSSVRQPVHRQALAGGQAVARKPRIPALDRRDGRLEQAGDRRERVAPADLDSSS